MGEESLLAPLWTYQTVINVLLSPWEHKLKPNSVTDKLGSQQALHAHTRLQLIVKHIIDNAYIIHPTHF